MTEKEFLANRRAARKKLGRENSAWIDSALSLVGIVNATDGDFRGMTEFWEIMVALATPQNAVDAGVQAATAEPVTAEQTVTDEQVGRACLARWNAIWASKYRGIHPCERWSDIVSIIGEKDARKEETWMRAALEASRVSPSLEGQPEPNKRRGTLAADLRKESDCLAMEAADEIAERPGPFSSTEELLDEYFGVKQSLAGNIARIEAEITELEALLNRPLTRRAIITDRDLEAAVRRAARWQPSVDRIRAEYAGKGGRFIEFGTHGDLVREGFVDGELSSLRRAFRILKGESE
jgi:hypothetical protein